MLARKPSFRPQFEQLEDRSVPAVLTVTTLADAGAGSLRQSIQDAAAGDTVAFAANVTGTIQLNSTLSINKSLSIAGPGQDRLTVSGGLGIRGFSVSLTASSNATLSGMTIANGSLPGSGSQGGGVRATLFSGSSLTVTTCTFSGNSAADGGGMWCLGPGTAVVTDCIFSGNSAREGGGGLYTGVNCTVSNSTFTGNSAEEIGGGICQELSGLTLTLTNSTIAGNTSGGGGGGLFVTRAVIANSTITYNSAGGGGGITILTDFHVLTMANTIVAMNHANFRPDMVQFGSDWLSLGHNLIGNTQGVSGFHATDILDVDPLLGPLQDNGGPTPTISPLFGSPAIDAGDNGNGGLSVPSADQRGRTRIANGTIDIGAFEVQPSSLQDDVEAIWDGSSTDTEIDFAVNQGNIGTYLAAVADVTPNPSAAQTADVVFDLGGNTVSGPTVRVPAGVTLTFTNGAFVGASPALTVLAGNVIVRNSTLTNATDAPTVRLVGGSLTLRDSVVQESTGFDQVAIRVEGGALDLGTPSDPGGNTININGTGEQLVNSGGQPVTMYGVTWQDNGTTQTGGTVESGQAAGIGFWANKNGRALINALGATDEGVSRVGTWLAATYPNLFGNLTGSAPDGVWDYMRALKSVTGGLKLEAQVMATALSVYVTTLSLNTTSLGRATAEKYGFDLSNGSLGSEAVPVSAAQASALGLSGAGDYSVGQLLAAADVLASGGWLFLPPADATKRQAAYDLFAFIIGNGDIG